ncbi:MAG TPA: sigma 54-interacting transcriptional regulator [Polyangiaceae bacterium]|nr:sigma 54-interacting transcriptional regulator [Polyangiaceae bacterium]
MASTKTQTQVPDSITAQTGDDDRPVVVRSAGAGQLPGVVRVFPRALGDAPACWPVAKAISVGRSRRADVQIEDGGISRVHADLTPHRDGFVVSDRGSRHGSFVNAAPVPGEGALAKHGSIIRLGDTLLLVVDDIGPYRAPSRTMAGATLGLARDMLAGPALGRVWDQATRVAQLSEPVLILGESGSGKECVARMVHAFRTVPGPFVGLNVAAIPEPLFEAELFGFERGAFTGAAHGRAGAFRDASSGVLFLDEVGDLRPDLQTKLLRAIDLQRVRPLGGSRDVGVDVRLVTATNHDLREACEAGRFRSDLYYRLMGVVIRMPPLRERRDEVILLALSILRDQAEQLALSCDAAEVLVLASWEGNARQLRYAVTHAAGQALVGRCDEVKRAHLPDLAPVEPVDGAMTEARIRTAMKRSNGVASRAAEALGVSRTTLYNALRRLKIDSASLRTRT